MLQIKDIRKTYKTGELIQTALNGVSLNFRDNEFVAILGPSGSGKTTLLNIIGGLDKYDEGDLIINNVSTKDYKDRDWDAYRNHTIGFIFQSYNLIPHQTVLANVELALTISGISSKERKKRALDALEAVGLKEQAHKKPNQMSGGQMQRVAIARALVNNPSIVLADEPTGALDTKTSVQVMELLKEVAKDRLVIMVTHNPELAEQYANRIVNLKDGDITGDTNPYILEEEEIEPPVKKRLGNAKMGFFTALSLSFNNLLTKKGRTLLTAFAGSIGIIGIALILALSTGFQNYIDDIQEETMSSYPLTIQSETSNVFGALLTAHVDANKEDIPEGSVKETMVISSMMGSIGSNDLESFMNWLDENKELYENDVEKITYAYSVSPRIYTKDVTGAIAQLNPNTIMSSFYSDSAMSLLSSVSSSSSMGTFAEYETDTLKESCELLIGDWPSNYNEVLVVLSQKDKIPDLFVYSLGLREAAELKTIFSQVMTGEEVSIVNEPMTITYEDLMNIELKLIDVTDLYKYNAKYNTYEDMTGDEDYMNKIYRQSEDIKITGVAYATGDSNLAGVMYSHALVEHVIEKASQSPIVQKQLNNKDIDVFSGNRFDDEKENSGIDFNDMVSVDEEMLKKAFKVNISESDFNFNMMSSEDMMKVADKYASMYAPMISSSSEMVVGLNTVIFNSIISTYEGSPLIPGSRVQTVLTDPSDPSTAYLKIDISDYDTYGDGINAAYYKAALNTLVENIGSLGLPSDTTQIITAASSILTDTDYADLAESSKLMFKKYYQTIATTCTAGSEIIYTINPTDMTRTYSDGVNTLSSTTLFATSAMIPEVATKYATVSNNLAKSLMSAGVLMSTAEIMTPMAESLSGLQNVFSKDIMTVDTNAFAKAFNFNMNEDELQRLMSSMLTGSTASYKNNLTNLGYQNIDEPTSISIYFKNFNAKDNFMKLIDKYNSIVNDEEKEISYVDMTGVLMSSVQTIVNAVTYVLIAFVSISLFVSSIMIAVITLISVMERTKEIGILRAMGASKKNVSSIFNAETFIIGLLSGTLGVTVSYLATFPINNIIYKLTDIDNIKATLGLKPAIILIIISVVLTMIAGFIPSKKAAKQDPVIALRTE